MLHSATFVILYCITNIIFFVQAQFFLILFLFKMCSQIHNWRRHLFKLFMLSFDTFFTNLPYFYLKDFLQFWPKIIQQFYSISYFPNKFLLYCFFLVYNWYTPNYIKATFFLVKDRSKLCLLRMYYAGKKI